MPPGHGAAAEEALGGAAGDFPLGLAFVEGGATRSASVRNALAAAGGRRRGRRPRRRAAAGRRRPVPRTLAALADADAAIAAARVTDTIKEAGPDGRRRAHARPLAPVGDPDAAGVPRRRSCGARSTSPDDVLAAATDDAWLVERAGGTRARRRVPARQLQGDDAARPGARREPAVLTDYHVHLRPDDDDTAAGALLHRRQRRALPRRPPRSAGSPSSASPSTSTASRQALEVWQHPWWRRWARDDVDDYCALRARGDRPAARHRGRLRGRPRGPASRASSRRASGTTSIGSVHFVRDAAVDLEGAEWEHVWGRGDRPDRSGSATSRRSPRRPAPGSTTSWPTPTSSRSGAAPGRSPSATRATTTSPPSRRCSRPASRWRSPPPGCASPSARSIPAPALLEMAVDAGLPIALSSDAHVPEPARLPLRRRASPRSRTRA